MAELPNGSEKKICGVLFGDPAQAQQSGLCGERTSDGMYELSRSSGSEGIVVREDEAGFGEGTPQQDWPQDQNEQRAKFGTVVESCSNYFRYPLNGDFCNTPLLDNGQVLRKTWYPFTLQRTFFRQNTGLGNVKFRWTAFTRYQVLSLIRNFSGQKSTVMQKFLWKFFSLLVRTFAGEKSTG